MLSKAEYGILSIWSSTMKRHSVVLWSSAIFLCFSSLVNPTGLSPQDSCSQNRDEWVMDTLVKIESITPGMTREELMKVFRTEGGLATGLHRTFISRECPYFKVDVEFRAVGRPARDSDGRVTLEEDARDIIVKISRPYLQFAIAD
jgi:hypothetical protein